MRHDPGSLPTRLAAPIDDGAARHLIGLDVPDVALSATRGGPVNLRRRSHDLRVVVFVYPRTGIPGVEPPLGWDATPGARGCTPEACSFRDLFERFTASDTAVYGLSTQDTAYQQEAAVRLELPYALLSDADLHFATTLRLPTLPSRA